MAHYINFFGANSRDLRQHVDYLASLAWALTAWARLDRRGKKSTCLNPLSEYRTPDAGASANVHRNNPTRRNGCRCVAHAHRLGARAVFTCPGDRPPSRARKGPRRATSQRTTLHDRVREHRHPHPEDHLFGPVCDLEDGTRGRCRSAGDQDRRFSEEGRGHLQQRKSRGADTARRGQGADQYHDRGRLARR